MLYDDISSILTHIKRTQKSSTTTVFIDGEPVEDATLPFLVIKNNSIGTTAALDDVCTTAEESFEIMVYDKNAPLTRQLAIKVRNSLMFSKVGTLKIGVIELLEGTARLDEGYYFQKLRFKMKFIESH